MSASQAEIRIFGGMRAAGANVRVSLFLPHHPDLAGETSLNGPCPGSLDIVLGAVGADTFRAIVSLWNSNHLFLQVKLGRLNIMVWKGR